MKKEEYIRKFGEDAYESKLEYVRKYSGKGGLGYDKKLAYSRNSRCKGSPGYESYLAYIIKNRRKGGPGYENYLAYRRRYKNTGGLGHEKQLAYNRKYCGKGGPGYAYNMTGLRHERTLMRKKHQRRWTKYKNIIAPGSEIHHEWIPGTADYRGVALVEADKHRYGIIDVIQILEGEITLVREL